MDNSVLIERGGAVLGIELGSTRIKAALTDGINVLATGGFEWENQLVDGVWTYAEEDIIKGLRACYKSLKADVKAKYGVTLKSLKAIGVSAMMHGYIVLDDGGRLLTPFRTWRNVITGEAVGVLSPLFGVNIPERWSIAHLYQAVLNGESHVGSIDYMTTLAGYVHLRLTGRRVVGVGEASGMFPIDDKTGDYDTAMLAKFDALVANKGYGWRLKAILPEVMTAGDEGGRLTADGAKLLDEDGDLAEGILLCPPEGDAGTGMVATNSVAVGTGNVSAGTSVFAMVVLDKSLNAPHREIDMVTTPDGRPVAMVHCNNCTSDINAWVGLLHEFATDLGVNIDKGALFERLFTKALEGDPSCGGLTAVNYLSGESITSMEEGRPLFVRTPLSEFSLANFMRTHLMSALATLKIGLDILSGEGVKISVINGHGGYFKTKEVGQRIMAAAVGAPVTVTESAGEGGAWGMALLAAYAAEKEKPGLAEYLDKRVFGGMTSYTVAPRPEETDGFSRYLVRFKKCLDAERAAVKEIKDE